MFILHYQDVYKLLITNTDLVDWSTFCVANKSQRCEAVGSKSISLDLNSLFTLVVKTKHLNISLIKEYKLGIMNHIVHTWC